MKKVEGVAMPYLPVSGLRRVRDLITFDGPLLTQYVHPSGDHFLYYWVDCDDKMDRWMVLRVNETSILRLVNQFIPLDQVIPKGCRDDFVYLKDVAREGTKSHVTIVNLDLLPLDYLPAEGTFLDKPKTHARLSRPPSQGRLAPRIARMARLDDLVAEVREPMLRRKLQDAIADLKRKQRLGLVFEEHLPETTALRGLPIALGSTVQSRDERDGPLYRVVANGNGKVIVEPHGGGERFKVAKNSLLVVKRFGDPIYPALKSLGVIVRGGSERPFHAVINGENYHTLQLLTYLYAGKVDCIYIDPPYNSGARDWKYNNRYVDQNDAWRHSKWLSFMKRRLLIAKQLLNPSNAVLIVTIDEKEYLRLGMLLHQLFDNCKIQMISTVISPSGAARNIEFTRVNEYVFFVMLGDAIPCKTADDMLFTDTRSVTANRSPIWNSLRRLGAGPARTDSPSKFYPVLVDPATRRIVGAGDSLPRGTSKGTYKTPSGKVAVWPIMTNGEDGRWELARASLLDRIPKGYVRAVEGTQPRSFSIQYLRNAQIERLGNGELVSFGIGPDGSLCIDYAEDRPRELYAKTIWNKPSHDSRTYGSWVLREFVPGRQFPFPKSLYAVEDALRFFLKDKQDALVLDFFAGSGTTTHAVFRLNHQDGGQRRSVSITNNEVSADEAATLREKGLKPGDAEWESLGIFEHITRPRITAAATGETPEGETVQGEYKFIDPFPMSNGFAENVEFFRIDYLEPDDIDLGTQFDAILPALWLAAGGAGQREHGVSKNAYSIPTGSPYAVLFRESAFRKFREELIQRPDVKHVWLVTDSEEAFAEMNSALPHDLYVSMLYSDYLRNFRVNARPNS